MAEVVPVSGFGVPPLPQSANVSQHSRETPGAPAAPPPMPNVPPSNQQFPGYVPPAPQGGLTAEQVQEMIRAATKPAVPAVAPVAQAPLTPNTGTFDFAEDSGKDPILSSLTGIFLGAAQGIDIDRALGKAITYGDPALIDLAYIAEKGGVNANHLVGIAKGIVERIQSQAASATTAVYAIAGDQAQWNAASAAFNQNAPAYQKQVIAQMLDSGNPEAIKAAAQSVVEFARNAGLVSTPAQLLTPSNGFSNAGQALSKPEFQEALQKLDKNSRTFNQERDALFAGRMLGKQLGK